MTWLAIISDWPQSQSSLEGTEYVVQTYLALCLSPFSLHPLSSPFHLTSTPQQNVIKSPVHAIKAEKKISSRVSILFSMTDLRECTMHIYLLYLLKYKSKFSFSFANKFAQNIRSFSHEKSNLKQRRKMKLIPRVNLFFAGLMCKGLICAEILFVSL